MKKISIFRLFSVFLCLILMLSLAGCSKNSGSDDDEDDDRPRTEDNRRDDDDTSGSSGTNLFDMLKNKDGDNPSDGGSSDTYTGDSNNNGGSTDYNSGDSGSDTVPQIVRGRSDADAELTIYKIGDNSLVVAVKGSACAAVKPRKDSYSGDKEFYFEVESMGLKSTLQGSYTWCQFDGGDYYSSSDDDTFVGKDIYYARMDYEGICSRFDLSGDYIFVYKNANSGTSDGDIIREGKAADIVKTMTEEEFSKLVLDAYMGAEADNPAQADWNGTYTLDYSYDNDDGYVSAEVTEGGLIHFHLKYNDYERDIFAEEKNYDAVEYVYGKYVSAEVEVIGKNRYNKEFKLKQDPDTPARIEISYSDYNVEPSIWISSSFTKFVPWHIAPDGYKDEDTAGCISALDLTQEPFKPVNDDYTINCNLKASVWTDEGDIYCQEVVLCSYDANGMQIQEVTAYIAENEDDARRILKRKQADAYDYYTVTMSGNTVYRDKKQDDYWYDCKLSRIGSVASGTWYVGCHYAYQSGFGDQYSNSYVYINKPITKDEYDIPLDAGLYWKKKNGTRRSMDLMDVRLYTYISSYSTELSIYGSSGFNNLSFEGARTVRFHGMSAESVYYDREWSSGDYVHYVIFRTYEFGEEETVTTDYFFKVDSFENIDITFDNFKDKTADGVVSQRFDMVREAN